MWRWGFGAHCIEAERVQKLCLLLCPRQETYLPYACFAACSSLTSRFMAVHSRTWLVFTCSFTCQQLLSCLMLRHCSWRTELTCQSQMASYHNSCHNSRSIHWAPKSALPTEKEGSCCLTSGDLTPITSVESVDTRHLFLVCVFLDMREKYRIKDCLFWFRCQAH